jgi:hypothetical protein
VFTYYEISNTNVTQTIDLDGFSSFGVFGEFKFMNNYWNEGEGDRTRVVYERGALSTMRTDKDVRFLNNKPFFF